jgi:uncharacterized glyoxalase superfamily protein PhnB
MTATSTTVSLTVGVDPATAFTAFTEELDLWWVRGPINYFDAARAIAMRCEPGVGGRLLEVYDQQTGEGLELGRITVWEPSARLAWKSSLDDVQIDVRFEPSGSGTDITVTATIPDPGEDRGGTAWVRVVPKWFGAWCARRDVAGRPQPELARLAVGVHYAKPAAAAQWLASVFGFESPDPLPAGPDPLPEGEYGPPWIEFRIGNCSLMLFKLDGRLSPESAATHDVWVAVDDLDAHLTRAEGCGAKILRGISQTGFRAYTAEDLEGHRWTFTQARPNQT